MVGWTFRVLRGILGGRPRTPEEEEAALRALDEVRKERERRVADEAEMRTRIGLRWPRR